MGAIIFTFPNGTRYEGEFRNGKATGFGTRTLVRDDPIVPEAKEGQWIGERFVQKGLFDDSHFVVACSNKEDCKKAKARTENEKNEEQAREREESEKQARVCDSYYPGRTGQIKGEGWLATKDGFIVRYVNKDRRMVTIEGTTGGNSLKSGETREFSCERLKHYEQ